MNSDQAKLLLQDGDAIAKLCAGHANPEDAVRAALEATNQAVPAIIGQMGHNLAEIVADPCLTVTEGVFTWGGKIPGDEDVERVVKKAVAFFSCSDSAGNMGRWILGNLATLAEEVMGDQWLAFFDGTELAYNTIVTSKTTFQFFREKRYPMPFSHHKAIAYAADLSIEQKHAIAAFAAESGLTNTTVTKLIKATQEQVKAAGEIETPEQIHATLDITPVRQVKRFLVIGAENDSRIVDRAPVGAEMEEAQEVYEIRSILKTRTERGGGADAGEPVREAEPADQLVEPDAG